MIKAIVFDMDGVLIDAKDWHYKALNLALNKYGFNINYEDHLKNFDGLPTKVKLIILSEKYGLDKLLHDEINALKQQYTIKLAYELCKPNKNHLYALSMLKNTGYKIALASNSIKSTIETMMNLSGLIYFFDFLISNEDVVKPKPDPEIYNLAKTKLKLKSSEILILEDNINGINAALASGCNLMKISTIDDVNYESIINKIREIEVI